MLRRPRRPSEDGYPLLLESRSDLWAEAVDLAQFDPASQSVFQKKAGFLHADQGEGAAGLDLHGDIYVAVGAIVAAGNGAKHRQMTHAAPAEFGFLRRKSLSHSVKSVRRHGVCPGIPSSCEA
jgi:hypothetical protein